jgi:hypothetical protein
VIEGLLRDGDNVLASAAQLLLPADSTLPVQANPTEIIPLGWTGESSGAFWFSWTGATGKLTWTPASYPADAAGFRAAVQLAAPGLASGDTVEVCTRGTFPTDSPLGAGGIQVARSSQSAGAEVISSADGWHCVKEIPELDPLTETVSVGYFASNEGWHPYSYDLADGTAVAPPTYEWEVWVRSMGEKALPEGPSDALGAAPQGALTTSSSGGIVYLATSRHVARSRDFYTSQTPHWENIQGSMTIPVGSQGRGGVMELALDPFNPVNRAWVAIGDPDSSGYGSLWRTDDLDSAIPTWVKVLTEVQIAAGTGHSWDAVYRVQASNSNQG